MCGVRTAAISRDRVGVRAFTLIELLVVVAILALLIAILLPSLERARAQARSSLCLSNEHQFGIAANLFASESKGYIPRGGDYTTLSWVQLVVRQLGDKNSYRGPDGKRNVNLIPVERNGVFQCPERRNVVGAPFLDYVVNALDSKGPRQATGGQAGAPPRNSAEWQSNRWFEVKGASRIDVWRHPAKVVYIMDAAPETRTASDDLYYVRMNINTLRATPGAGLDRYDVFRGGQVPGWPDDLKRDQDWDPRAALQMHSKRFSNALFADGHAGAVTPPPAPSGMPSPVAMEGRYQYYLRLFGVQIPTNPAPSRIAKLEAPGANAGSPEGNPTIDF